MLCCMLAREETNCTEVLSWSDNIGGTDAVYQNIQEPKAGLVKAYKEFVEEFAAVGGKILQFDDCLHPAMAVTN
ncbi:hypothetical protein SAMN05518856_11484 [Paenibacillus sp. OK003]|nr:hypothetical protein SAMN05518856_11484 [Paenibacillus sp. OK003]